MPTSMERFKNTLIRYTEALLTAKSVTPIHEYDQFTAAIMSDTELDVGSGYQLLLVDDIEEFVEIEDLISQAIRSVCQKFDRSTNVNKLQDLIIFIRLLTYVKPCLKDGCTVARSRDLSGLGVDGDAPTKETYKSNRLNKVMHAVTQYIGQLIHSDEPLTEEDYKSLVDAVKEETIHDPATGLIKMPVDDIPDLLQMYGFMISNNDKLLRLCLDPKYRSKGKNIVNTLVFLNRFRGYISSKEGLEEKEE